MNPRFTTSHTSARAWPTNLASSHLSLKVFPYSRFTVYFGGREPHYFPRAFRVRVPPRALPTYFRHVRLKRHAYDDLYSKKYIYDNPDTTFLLCCSKYSIERAAPALPGHPHLLQE